MIKPPQFFLNARTMRAQADLQKSARWKDENQLQRGGRSGPSGIKQDGVSEVGEKITRAAMTLAACGHISGGATAPARQHFAQLSQALPDCECDA